MDCPRTSAEKLGLCESYNIQVSMQMQMFAYLLQSQPAQEAQREGQGSRRGARMGRA